MFHGNDPVKSVANGLSPTPEAASDKKPAGISSVNGNGIERNVQNGTKTMQVILRPTISKAP